MKEIEYFEASFFQKSEFLKHSCSSKKIQTLNCSLKINLDKADIKVVERVFNSIIERHKIFRTILVMEKDEILQKVLPYNSKMLKIDLLDISDISQNSEILNNIIFQRRYRIFLPDECPWMDVCLIKISSSENLLFINIPHMIIDGVSINCLERELREFYKAYSKNESISLPEAFQFGEYIQDVYKEINSSKGYEHKMYWSHILQDLPKRNLTTEFSKDKTKRIKSYEESILSELKETFGEISDKTKKSFLGNVSYIQLKQGAAYDFFLNGSRFEILKRLSISANINLPTIIQSVFFLLILKLTGEKDIIMGMSANNRNRKEYSEVIGFLISTILLRHSINKDKKIIDFVKEIYMSTLKSLKHKIYPFDQVLWESDLSLQFIGSLFLNIISNNTPMREKKYDYLPDKCDEIIYYTYFDIDCNINVFTNGIMFYCRYHSESFNRETIEMIFSNYISIIDKLINYSELKVEDIL
jgi:hypothetical protein